MSKQSRPIVELDSELNYITEHESISEASRITKFAISSLIRNLKKRSLFLFDRIFLYKEDYERNDWRATYIDYKKQCVKDPILEIDRKTLKVIHKFSTIKGAARSRDIAPITVKRCIRNITPCISSKTNSFFLRESDYLKDPSMTAHINCSFTKGLRVRRKDYRICKINHATGLVVDEFKNVEECSKKEKKCFTMIYKYIRKNLVIEGHRYAWKRMVKFTNV